MTFPVAVIPRQAVSFAFTACGSWGGHTVAGKHSLIGLKEMAPLFGIQPHTTAMWRYRGLLPEPDYEISGSPIWELPTLLRWGRETNRAVVGAPDRLESGDADDQLPADGGPTAGSEGDPS